jgi:choline kinase
MLIVAFDGSGIKMETSETPARHAIVLAAGRGSRLEPEEGHKLLVSIEGETLLDRHLERFADWNVTDVTIVTGYRHRELEASLEGWETPEGLTLHTAVNPAFDASNGLSVLAGVRGAERNEAVDEATPFWLTMSDHCFEPGLTEVVVESFPTEDRDELEGLLAIDTKIETIFDLPDANKVRRGDGEGGRRSLEAIGKELEDFDCIDAGLFWCDRGFVDALEGERKARGDATTSDAVRQLADREAFYFLDIGDTLWQDVDTPEARGHVSNLVEHDWNLS